MYFAKARKQMEEQDMQEVQEKLEKYQRSDTARVLQQAKSSRTEDSSSRQTRDDFRPEELPDGAFVSPKHTPSHSASVSTSDPATFSSVAEYIGSFSVTGTDEDARARVVETQLQALRSVTKSKKVVLIISLGGVKVFSSDLQTLYMFHELKRIAYATCDPDHCQFSFLAREPKGQMNLQYCHVFTTPTPDEATELNTIIGNAFKMAYAQQRERQPTFHELIEAQVAEQRAKFLEIEKQAQAELQRKLAEIARPTPFSQQAIQRMEQRRQAQEDVTAEPEVVGRQRVWAKQAVDKVQHRFSLHEVSMPSTSQPIPSRLSEPHALPSSSSDKSAKGAGGGKSYVHKNITKHNSAPLFPAQLPSPSEEPPAQGEQVSCVIPHHPLSAQAIRVSIESKKDSKFKGSPVTVLKNEIDRRFLSNGCETQPVEPTSMAAASLCLDASERETDQKAIRHEQVRHQIQMANRPLPSVPPSFSPPPQAARVSGSSSSNISNNNQPKATPRQRPSSSYQWRSVDDHSSLPSSSSSPAPLSSPKSNNGVAIRASPHKKQPRPLSEIATGSGGVVAGGGGGGTSGVRVFESRVLESRYHHHHSSSYEVTASGSSSSSSSSQHLQYTTSVQASTSAAAPATTSSSTPPPPSSPPVEGELYVYGPSTGGVMAELRAGGKGPRFESSPRAGGVLSRGTSCPSGNTELVLRYQNDSPFLSEDPDATEKSRQGLESLMCLDRSHIEDPTLRQAPWYQAGIPREIALEILSQEEVGSFIVRDSTTHPGCFALSVRVPKFENSSGISHYLILKTHRGVRLKGLDKEWPNLTALVTHHTVMPEMLPCTLRLPRNNKNLTFRQTERDEADDDEEEEEDDDDDDANYQRLTEVTALAGQLKLT